MTSPHPAETPPRLAIDWENVHEQVQTLWGLLADGVHRYLPAIRSKQGQTTGRAWWLYTYRDFSWPDDEDAEAVGAGFAPAAGATGVEVKGEICGEETGHLYFEVEAAVIPATPADVSAAAQHVALLLSRQVEIVVGALNERQPPPKYRDRSP